MQLETTVVQQESEQYESAHMCVVALIYNIIYTYVCVGM